MHCYLNKKKHIFRSKNFFLNIVFCFIILFFFLLDFCDFSLSILNCVSYFLNSIELFFSIPLFFPRNFFFVCKASHFNTSESISLSISSKVSPILSNVPSIVFRIFAFYPFCSFAPYQSFENSPTKKSTDSREFG